MSIVNIPGRRLTQGETFYTDWIARGGDSMLLHAEVIRQSDSGAAIEITVETRSEPGVAEAAVDPTYPASATKLTISSVTVGTGLWRSTTSTGLKAQLRLMVACTGTAGEYAVTRVFAPIFFDNAKV